jgi:hypothetical protein
VPGKFGAVTSASYHILLINSRPEDPSFQPLHTSKFPSFTSHPESAPDSNLCRCIFEAEPPFTHSLSAGRSKLDLH